jgi:L-ascorbate metabolism protein UlaG (beta-lactamase superfamily)
MNEVRITLVGDQTVLIEVDGFRLLTDPTFDAPGSYALPHVTLVKTSNPALKPNEIGRVDAVLLSHDQHADNLDHAGRAFLAGVSRVFTTAAAAKRLAGRIEDLAPWQEAELRAADGSTLRIIATPARHGPAGIEPLSGDVIGFVVTSERSPSAQIYVTGDTVWYEGVAEVARRFQPGIVLVFAGAARTRGSLRLTMDSNDAIETAHAFPNARIVPVHCDGWAHFTESRDDIEKAFKTLGLGTRLQLLNPGVPASFDLAS